MVYNRMHWLPRVLRNAGIEVVLHKGWRTRGLGTYRPFDPKYVVWHHDASAPGNSPGVPGYMIRNYGRAAAQVWVDRRGRWHIIASGRAPHAGATRNHVVNENSIGIETDHTTGEEWPPALLDSLRRGTKAIFDHLNVGANHLHFHKSICDPPGRKVDPDGLNLGRERNRVANCNTNPGKGGAHKKRKRKPRKPPVSIRRARRVASRRMWARAWGKIDREHGRRIREALHEAGFNTYAEWQRSLGYRGADADGIPGETSLRALARRTGNFRVVR